MTGTCLLAVALAVAPAAMAAQGEENSRTSRDPAAGATGDEPDRRALRRAHSGTVPLGEGMRAFLSATIASKPGRLRAGEPGSLLVFLALRGKGVIEAGAKFDVDYAPQQGELRLGAWRRDPARKGRHHTHYAGTPVYDDTLTITIPIRATADAAPGEHEVALRVATTLANGETGVAIGPLGETLRGTVQVAGRPRPDAAGSPERRDAAATTAGRRGPAAGEARRGEARDAARPEQSGESAAPRSEAREAPSATPPPPSPAEAEAPGPAAGPPAGRPARTLLWALMLGAAAAAAALMLLGRRRA